MVCFVVLDVKVLTSRTLLVMSRCSPAGLWSAAADIQYVPQWHLQGKLVFRR